ncbi:hypothetical protein [Paraburkholderia dinghuensis]|uniref:Fis family transcriptional regulator n=1 Tax=Paraburkholderia dinghuensis TaxID=2305225 RepID=A0A3N6MS53_9BURK|nr:hypothetical protein [Paraburkholderia dinghuensis]RQH00631.1 hypothetical protein D1Y85_24930 [Paraburkholderia dinghuensis]
MLLPLPVARGRALSLENHLALATVRAGHGNPDQLCRLLQVVYLAFYLREETAAGAEIDPYRRAEAALDACIRRVKHHTPCLMLDLELAAVERVVVLHDQQLAGTSKHRYAQAWERLQRFIASQQRSPIPAIATGQ